ncbi:hypothetical protein A3C09_04350 [Candidatus Uhrbacteria bacterium RIFCSPHIGHO2_02_FULL_47_44]|uniref:Adenylosuccinate synthetase n=1 Tax=Candidatus Uhrbacteria bacterium RIFCSPLOWO2_02_FULL_48_18 TaxID=1802408 RepID=A0A1F7V9U2_9BACT|nr:MAG: hypothetical protein A2839_02695 [Candidatus Uhrbacteria bacterium RIFCSPHIGHO2_01_FULL_47_10]OGL70770.1 MAG: hypothetical protein A3C09_04350 [Candidatus Uhrbacteria bacterium RIFCSPHIGHO2_02_FULL_47_44]OGL82234.1 MAG: hypothetical protein A3B20_00575 [Candidatus Uhrbacteria bacterium RIFCSPLOWO2_01_FULL_47_17]OGL86724.1 MAG: hypothetical protein A3I41_05340 [Candidatus Uhrbacteria bacterium RIFCSPLOWO2_02_FULL_48_18]OGL91971.1 MAG: hypothetical protein A3H12_01970 [Candidatus Uhrbacte
MPATVVLGAQWGDEGKGKIIDALAEDADVVVRFQGGANAGHTIVIGDKTYPIHLLPSGIFRKGKLNLVGPGVVFDLAVGLQELELANEFGSRVMLDEQTPIVLPMHRLIDAAREVAAGSSAIGTTKRGIGPAYSDFWLRRSVTFDDLRSREKLEAALSQQYWNEMFAVVSMLGGASIDFRSLGMPFNPLHREDTIDWCLSAGEVLALHISDTRACVHNALTRNQNVLFEGAQGVMLDAYHGSRPYVTSSLCTAAGVSASFGVYTFDRVIGVAKAYTTRVGAGPFPTERLDTQGEELRRRGHEFGTTTGRPRRCGWLDLPALRYACRVGGITELVITKLDILTDHPRIFVCDDYANFDEHATLTHSVLQSAKTRYRRMCGWKEDLSMHEHFNDLPLSAHMYIDYIEVATYTAVSGVGVGAERNQILWR